MNTSSLPSVFQSTLFYHYLSYFKTRNYKTQLPYFFFLKRVGNVVKGQKNLFLMAGEQGERGANKAPFPHGWGAG